MLLEHRHDEKRSSTAPINERDKRPKTCLVGCFLPDVGDMNALLCFHEACERDARIIGLDIRWLPLPILDAMPRDRTEGLPLAKEKIAELRFANTRGTA